MTRDGRYHKSTPDDHQWRRLDLPHDWGIEGTPEQNAPAGGGEESDGTPEVT